MNLKPKLNVDISTLSIDQDTLEAMIKDSKSIEGVVKKINKHK